MKHLDIWGFCVTCGFRDQLYLKPPVVRNAWTLRVRDLIRGVGAHTARFIYTPHGTAVSDEFKLMQHPGWKECHRTSPGTTIFTNGGLDSNEKEIIGRYIYWYWPKQVFLVGLSGYAILHGSRPFTLYASNSRSGDWAAVGYVRSMLYRASQWMQLEYA